MKTSTRERILAARSPDDLKLAIIAALEEIEAAQPADPWASGWDQPTYVPGITIEGGDFRAPVDSVEAYRRQRENDEGLKAQIAAVKQQIAESSDPEDTRALQAKLDLLQDNGAPMATTHIDEGRAVGILSDGTIGDVNIPPASPERQARRREWATKRNLHEFLGPEWVNDPEGCAEAYGKGGPLWVYLGNRAAIMMMPDPWRQEMIDDVAEDSPSDAHDMARDILKRADELDPEGSAAGQHQLRREVNY